MATLRWRFILSHILPLLLVMPLLGVVFVFLLESQVILVNLSVQLERQAKLIAEFVVDSPQLWADPETAAQIVARFDPLTTANLSLLRADGRLLASGDAGESHQIGQLVPNVKLESLLNGIPYREVHYSGDLDDEVADIFVPIFDVNDQVIGIIRLTQELSTVYARFQRVRAIVFWVLLPGLLFGAGVGIVLATVLERPLTALTQQVSQVASPEKTASAVSTPMPLTERGPKEIRQLIRSFNQMFIHLHKLEGDRHHLLANLIHELSRPLGALRAAIDALLGGAVDEPRLRQKLLVGMDGEIQRLQRLLGDLGLLAHTTVDEFAILRQPVAMADWLYTTLSPWREDVQRQGIRWQEDLPDSLPILDIDPDRLGQALGNLLSNAIKYTPSGGRIAVEAGTNNTQFYIHVSDTGPGIPPHEQSHIFEPFYRSRSIADGGLGVGLAIARDLMEAHKGHLTVQSTPGQGSRFTLWLPMTDHEP